jgi:hypothetical protein
MISEIIVTEEVSWIFENRERLSLMSRVRELGYWDEDGTAYLVHEGVPLVVDIEDGVATVILDLSTLSARYDDLEGDYDET